MLCINCCALYIVTKRTSHKIQRQMNKTSQKLLQNIWSRLPEIPSFPFCCEKVKGKQCSALRAASEHHPLSCLGGMSAWKDDFVLVLQISREKSVILRVPDTAWCGERGRCCIRLYREPVNFFCSQKGCGTRAGMGFAGIGVFKMKGNPVSYLWRAKDVREGIFNLPNASLCVSSHQE